jgi:hypothetical protein
MYHLLQANDAVSRPFEAANGTAVSRRGGVATSAVI